MVLEMLSHLKMEMFKFTDLTFEDLLNARGTRAPTATLDRIEEFEDFLINRKKKEKADEITKEVPPIVSHYSFGSLCVNPTIHGGGLRFWSLEPSRVI